MGLGRGGKLDLHRIYLSIAAEEHNTETYFRNLLERSLI